MRHSSGWATLMSISFFMRSLPQLRAGHFILQFEPGPFQHGAGFE